MLREVWVKMWVKMWVNCLTHTLTHTWKCSERAKMSGRNIRPLISFRLAYITCAMKLPMVWAASSCFWRVAWV